MLSGPRRAIVDMGLIDALIKPTRGLHRHGQPQRAAVRAADKILVKEIFLLVLDLVKVHIVRRQGDLMKKSKPWKVF